VVTRGEGAPAEDITHDAAEAPTPAAAPDAPRATHQAAAAFAPEPGAPDSGTAAEAVVENATHPPATDGHDVLPEPAVASEITDSRPLDEDDWHGLARICGAINSAQLAWIRTDRFSRPWHDEHFRPFVELEPLVGSLRERPFSVELRAPLGTFAGALTAFAAFYGENTFPDPLLPATDWRFFDWSELIDAAPGTSNDGLWRDRAAQMQRLAMAMANAYEIVRDTAVSDPTVRARAQAAGTTARV
jgi:hypothetical protein